MKTLWQRFKRFIVSKKHDDPEDLNHLAELEKKLGYTFKDLNLLYLALVHRSYLSVSDYTIGRSNERLEFLGDAVLGFIVTEYLFDKYTRKNEGILTEYKSIIVSRKTLARIARQINLGNYLYLGQGEEQSGGRRRQSIISDAFEAVIGAIYLDGQYEATKKVIDRLILKQINKILQHDLYRNYKSRLLEYAQAKGLGLPHYEVQTENGPEHEKVFQIAVRVQGKIMGIGTGMNKKKAEQNAAHNALENMN